MEDEVREVIEAAKQVITGHASGNDIHNFITALAKAYLKYETPNGKKGKNEKARSNSRPAT